MSEATTPRGEVTPFRPRRAASYCVECDAPPRGCSHNGHRYLDAIRYDRIGDTPGGQPVWGVPEHERRRVDNPPSGWAKPEQRQPSADPTHNPFQCAGCGKPLAAWARERGFTYCTAECRGSHTS